AGTNRPGGWGRFRGYRHDYRRRRHARSQGVRRGRAVSIEKIRESLDGLAALASRVAAEQADAIAAIADRYETTLRGGGTLFFAGNGGSAADAQHIATEYVVRYRSNRPAIRAIARTTETSLLTACANDVGFDEVFARQVEALAEPGDLLVLHSTCGESPKVLRAERSAKARGVGVVALLGKTGGHRKEHADVAVG